MKCCSQNDPFSLHQDCTVKVGNSNETNFKKLSYMRMIFRLWILWAQYSSALFRINAGTNDHSSHLHGVLLLLTKKSQVCCWYAKTSNFCNFKPIMCCWRVQWHSNSVAVHSSLFITNCLFYREQSSVS